MRDIFEVPNPLKLVRVKLGCTPNFTFLVRLKIPQKFVVAGVVSGS